MFRLSGIFSIFLAIACGSLLFWTGESVQEAEKQLGSAQNNMEKEQESLRVLSAEWDFLNRPDRLEKLVNEGLSSGELENTKTFVHDIDSIPEPKIPTVPKRKPEDLLLYVGIKADKGKQEDTLREVKEGDDFNDLMNTLSEEPVR